MTMIEDPIVEEIHKIREQMLAEYGGLEGLVKHLREIQAEMPDRVVTLEPNLPSKRIDGCAVQVRTNKPQWP